MGIAAGGRCHVDASAALSFACAGQYPQLQGGTLYACQSSTASDLVLHVSSIPAGCTGTCAATVGTVTLQPALRACDETEWQAYYPLSLSMVDGALVSAAVVAVWASAWAFRALVSMLRDRADGD